MSKMNKTENVLDQYKDGSNLTTRVSLYDKYSVSQLNYKEWIWQQYEFEDGDAILEFGSGTGKDWQDHLDYIPNRATVIMSDFTDGMVDTLKERFSRHPQIDIKKLDIQEADITKESQKHVVANSMLYHVPDIKRAVSEVKRILKPGGVFYATTSSNSKCMMKFLKESLEDFDSSIQFPKEITFTLDNGGSYLEDVFNEYEIRRYTNTLKISKVEDLVAFIYSIYSIEGLQEAAKESMNEYYEGMKDDEGFITIVIEYGMFVCRK